MICLILTYNEKRPNELQLISNTNEMQIITFRKEKARKEIIVYMQRTLVPKDRILESI